MLKHQELQMFGHKLNPLQVVGRGSETQLQVSEKIMYLNYLI